MARTGGTTASVVVAGVAMTPSRRALPGTHLEVAGRLIREALADAGIPKEDVDGIFVTPPGLAGPPAFMFCCQLSSHLGMPVRNLALTECGGMSATAALGMAIDGIRLRRNRVCVVFALDRRGVDLPEDIETFVKTATVGQVGLYGAFDGPYGIGAPIPYYAMSAQRYMYEHGVAAEDIARVAVVLREHAALNPLAAYREPTCIEEVLASHMVSPPIHLLECSPFTSGAAAAVLVAGETVRGLHKPPIRILGVGEWHDGHHFVPPRGSLTSFEAPARAAREAFDEARLAPGEVDVAEVYGVFAATELILYEDLGFFEKGTAWRAVAEGRTGLGGRAAGVARGRTVFDTSGGRLSLGHPAAATPLMELAEIVWQLRGEAGERQVRGAEIGLVHAEHGMLNGSIVLLLGAQGGRS